MFLDVVFHEGGIIMDDRNSYRLGFLAASFMFTTIVVGYKLIGLASEIDETTRRINRFSNKVDRTEKMLREMKFPKIKRTYHLMSK